MRRNEARGTCSFLRADAPIQIAVSALAASGCLPQNLPRKRPVPNHVPPQIEIVDCDHGAAPGLTVRGEIDIATSPQLELALDKAIRESTGAFVLDLCELEFLDSSGLNLMLRARAALAREKRTMAIVCPPDRSTGDPDGVTWTISCSSMDSHTDVAAALIPSD